MQDIIGISLGNNTSVAVVNPLTGVRLAISEERLNGEKNTKKFPINALRKCLEFANIPKKNPHSPVKRKIYIGISSYEVINDRTMRYMDDESDLRTYFSDFYSFLKEYIRVECNIGKDTEIIIKRVDHHEAHMLPALYMSGFLLDEERPTISVTYDGFGDGVCATVINHDTNETIAKEHIENSLGLVYQYVTGALGFKEHQHEGKITGLAAFGEPKYKEIFEDFFIGYDRETKQFIPNYLNKGMSAHDFSRIEMNSNIHGFKNMLKLKDRVYSFVNHLMTNAKATKEDIAASVQEYTEDLISKWISDRLFMNDIHDCNIVLSGGVFANVKVNYRIKEFTPSKNLFVLPPMGDEGTSIGAAIALSIKLFGEGKIDKEEFGKDKLYLGSVEPDKRLASMSVDRKKYSIYHLSSFYDSQAIEAVGTLLANQKIVCISRGNSEFGPRALGNHSILFDAGKKETNDTLNAKLNRTEFMPFAPITIDKFSEDLFLNTKGLEKTLKYMTIAVPVTDEFKDNYHAAYHVDFTARPQVLHEVDNPIIYSIIEKYSNLSNKKALINTSFNLHNSPIIFDEQVAYDSFVQADLDALLLKNILIVKKEV